MKKKDSVPESERSAFEDARAALERAGEDPSATETFQAPETPEAVDGAETPEIADDAQIPEASASEADDGGETSEPDDDAQTPEAAAPETAENETPDAVQASEASAPEAGDDETSALASEPDDAQTPEAAAPETAENETPDAVQASETFVPAFGAEASAFDADANEPAPEITLAEESENIPEAPVSERVDNAPAESGGEPSGNGAPYAESVRAFAEGAEPEITKTEKHTMEIKEITLNPRRNNPADGAEEAEAVKAPRERAAKPRFQAFERIKETVRARAEADDGNPPSGSARDAALRKRVMQIEDDETRNYLLDRVLPQMTWYSKKSSHYQTMYYRFMALSIGLGALIPVCSIGGSHIFFKVVLAILGASVTAINAYLALHKYQELWISYRSTREELLHTLYSYFNQAGVFAQKKMSQEELNVLLVEVCENTLSKENGGWSTTILQKTS
ncbi:MAG: DUF4231 domain-containing protein [Oscillibacter sp.]|nr:DUF4231 domain-containing protein [Oscillibacter sp.]